MLSSVFKVVHGPKLQAMLTSVLKDIDVDELKELCLEQLEGMSKKRIRSVLSGQPMEDSSCTEDENGSEEEEEDNDGFRQGIYILQLFLIKSNRFLLTSLLEHELKEVKF